MEIHFSGQSIGSLSLCWESRKDARTIAKLNMNPNAGTNLIKIPSFSDYGTSFIIVNLGSLLKD